MTLLHHQIQYIEFLSRDFSIIKDFYSQCFGWSFTDYGESYTAFSGDHVDGGFAVGTPQVGSVLVILYSDHLEATRDIVADAGGAIVQDIYPFPGGRRFEFTDPEGNRLAVWSDT